MTTEPDAPRRRIPSILDMWKYSKDINTLRGMIDAAIVEEREAQEACLAANERLTALWTLGWEAIKEAPERIDLEDAVMTTYCKAQDARDRLRDLRRDLAAAETKAALAAIDRRRSTP